MRARSEFEHSLWHYLASEYITAASRLQFNCRTVHSVIYGMHYNSA